MLKPLVLLQLNTLLICVCQPNEVRVKAGDMALLQCPLFKQQIHMNAPVQWTSSAPWGPNLTGNMSDAQQMHTGVLVHRGSLVILSVSQHHRGNYSCSVGNDAGQFLQRLTVTAQLTRHHESCHAEESCTLHCPGEEVELPNVTAGDILWKDVRTRATGTHQTALAFPFPLPERPKTTYFPKVTESNGGLYDCTRTYRYRGQTYNMTFAVELAVQPNEISGKSPAITSPRANETFHVDLGSTVVIDCNAVTYNPDEDGLFWQNGDSFVRANDSEPIYYNKSHETIGEKTRMRASLIIKRVSVEDLSKKFLCKLELEMSEHLHVSITLRQKPLPPSPPYLPLALGIVCALLILTVAALVGARFKIEVALFLRDTLGLCRRGPDGKSHDAFVMCYRADPDAALSEPDRQWIVSVLEERFGYSLCLDERDALLGTAVAEAVLECVERSRTVLLVPTSSEPCLGSGLLSAIHEALVERQTGLVFIRTEAAAAAGVPAPGSEPEAFQLLCEAGNCVTWRGASSASPSSSFWKQLRYYLPAPQQVPNSNKLAIKQYA